MTPVEQYNACLSLPGFIDDAAQRGAIVRLDDLSRRLIDASNDEASLAGLLKARLVGNRRNVIKGLYMWGGVGRGKTFLMDLFFDCIPFPAKLRTHFHRFMQQYGLDRLRPADPLGSSRRSGGKRGCCASMNSSFPTSAMRCCSTSVPVEVVMLVATSNIPPQLV
jgi:cell division protein ZapE